MLSSWFNYHDKAGIYAVSRFRCRADIQVTSVHCVDHKEHVVVGIGALFTGLPLPALSKSNGNA